MTSNVPATAPATSDEGTSPADSATEPYAPDTRKPEDSSGETVSDGEGREHSALIWAVPCCAVAAGGIAAAVIAAKKRKKRNKRAQPTKIPGSASIRGFEIIAHMLTVCGIEPR